VTLCTAAFGAHRPIAFLVLAKMALMRGDSLLG
jgi:hypothetical protein